MCCTAADVEPRVSVDDRGSECIVGNLSGRESRWRPRVQIESNHVNKVLSFAEIRPEVVTTNLYLRTHLTHVENSEFGNLHIRFVLTVQFCDEPPPSGSVRIVSGSGLPMRGRLLARRRNVVRTLDCSSVLSTFSTLKKDLCNSSSIKEKGSGRAGLFLSCSFITKGSIYCTAKVR